MRRPLVFLATFFCLAALAMAAQAAGFDPAQMTFPVGGDSYRITDSFGDCRGTGCSRSHEGVDIMAPKGTPIYAAGAGTVTWASDTSNCCRLAIDHGNGWYTRYLHMNDDTQTAGGAYTTDDAGWGIAEGITNGTHVEAGQLIGWVGDSGNAVEGVTHLHFELRQGSSHHGSTPIDAYPYLIAAEGNYKGQFLDDEGSVHENNINKIFAEGITLGCNPPLNNKFCPVREITRGEMAAFIARALPLSATTGTPAYDDVDGHLFEVAIDKLHTAGIAFGCDSNSFCPDRPLLREEMAELLVRAFGYDNPSNTDFFVDDNGNPFEESINKLANHGITVGCNPPANDRYCPARTLQRAEMATFFVRSMGL